MFLEFDNAQAGRRKDEQQNRLLNCKYLQKEALVALRLEQAQVNFQNNLTESQMLIASPRPVIAVIFAYAKNQAPSILSNRVKSDGKDEDFDFEAEVSKLLEDHTKLSDVDLLLRNKDLTED